MSAKRVILLIFGILFILGAIIALASGGAMIWVSQFHKDSQGFHVTDPMRIKSDSYAVTSETIEIDRGAAKALYWLGMDVIKAEVESLDPSRPVFVGVANSWDVKKYLSGVAHEEVTDIELFGSRYEHSYFIGEVLPLPPASQGFWFEKAEGTGWQEIQFDLEEGDYALVAMNADASQGIEIHVVLGIKASGTVLAIGIVFIIIGLLALAGGIVMIIFGVRRPQPRIPAAPYPGPPQP